MDLLKKQVVVLICFLLFVGFLFLIQKSLNMPRDIPPISYSFKTAPASSGYALVNDNKESAGFTTFLNKLSTPKVPNARFEVKDASVDVSMTGVSSTDVNSQIKADGLSQDIMIKDATQASKAIKARERYTLTFPLNTKNVVPRSDIDGNLTPIFMDAKTKEYRFHVKIPVLVDAKGQTYPIPYTLSPSPYTLTLELPREWIADGARSFPIRITSGIFYNQERAFGE